MRALSWVGLFRPAASRAFLRSQLGSRPWSDCCHTLGGRNTEFAGTAQTTQCHYSTDKG